MLMINKLYVFVMPACDWDENFTKWFSRYCRLLNCVFTAELDIMYFSHVSFHLCWALKWTNAHFVFILNLMYIFCWMHYLILLNSILVLFWCFFSCKPECISPEFLTVSSRDLDMWANYVMAGVLLRTQWSAVSSVKLFGWSVPQKAASSNTTGQAISQSETGIFWMSSIWFNYAQKNSILYLHRIFYLLKRLWAQFM